jgi:hypothetical protein
MSSATNELIWMKELLESIGLKIHHPIDIKGDNQAQVKLVNRQELATRNVRVSYHNVQHEADKGTISVEWIEGKNNIADILTKPLAADLFEEFRNRLVVNIDRNNK